MGNGLIIKYQQVTKLIMRANNNHQGNYSILRQTGGILDEKVLNFNKKVSGFSRDGKWTPNDGPETIPKNPCVISDKRLRTPSFN